ncbi:hypothetical protein DYB32_010425, partial [Aphanomyces invadans]
STAGCKLFVWSDYNGGTCWLKNKVGAKTRSPGVRAAIVVADPPTPTPTPAPGCSGIEDNTDYYGYDLASTSQASADKCCGDCEATAGCKLFVWTDYNGGTCWLKHQVGPKAFLAGAKAAVRNTACSPLVQDVDYFGNDIRSSSQSNASGCCADCKATAGCKAYSWSDYNGGTCWLKSAKGVAIARPGIVSGTI